MPTAQAKAQAVEPLALGVMTSLRKDPNEVLGKVRDLGFPTCQLGNPPNEYIYGPQAQELTGRLMQAVADTGVKITAVFIGFPGQRYNLTEGPATVGLVPADKRGARVVHSCKMSDWARDAGLTAVTSHIGFIPEDPNDPNYEPFIDTMRAFCAYCRDNGQTFAFETGQETAQTLVRAIKDIGLDNVGINLDPANLILYGKSRPLEIVDLVAPYVFNTHCKDGTWPEAGANLGEETPLGEGEVHIQDLIRKLFAAGYRGPLTIEREISGDKQIEDILRAKQMLEALRAELLGSPAT